MTTRGKIVLTILLLGVVGFGMFRWWDKIAPTKPAAKHSRQPAGSAEGCSKQSRQTPLTDIPLLVGTNAATLVDALGHPAGHRRERLRKNMKDGKLVVEFPINVWPGWAPIIVANNGMEPNDQSVFAKKYRLLREARDRR